MADLGSALPGKGRGRARNVHTPPRFLRLQLHLDTQKCATGRFQCFMTVILFRVKLHHVLVLVLVYAIAKVDCCCTFAIAQAGQAECAERLNPPPLPYGKSWRVESKAQVRNCKSQICRSLTPLKSPPSAPAHSARPTQNMHRPGFCDFQKTLASAERAEKKLSDPGLVTNLHQKCKLQDASFIIFRL